MELIFLWIEEFRNIKKQAFNFSSEFLFEIRDQSKQKSEADYVINITHNRDSVKLFTDDILNVTGIVGRNGSGKSTLFHCLKLMCGNIQVMTSSVIFSVYDRDNQTIETYSYAHKSSKDLKVSVLEDYPLKKALTVLPIVPYKIDNFTNEKIQVKGYNFDFKNLVCCYFSNVFDAHSEAFYDGIQNLSTNYKLHMFLESYVESMQSEDISYRNEFPKKPFLSTHLNKFHKQELRNLLRFIAYANNRKRGYLPSLPKSLTIEFNTSDYEDIISRPATGGFLKRSVLESLQDRAVNIINASEDKKQNMLDLISISLLYFFIKNYKSISNEQLLSEIKNQITMLSDYSDFFNQVRLVLKLIISNSHESLETDLFNNFLSAEFNKSLNAIKFSDTDQASFNKAHFRVVIDNNLWGVLGAIYEFQSLYESAFIDYNWGGLSTGEEAFLTHFARLYEIKRIVASKPVWLIIDEGDLYFHPQWQKKYLSILFIYLNFIFNKNKLQVFISTHSPFITSDLPKQNLIFLSKNPESASIVVNKRDKKETFGANIHELFTDSFFLEDGLMGEFAREKIEELIHEVNNAKSISKDYYENNLRSRIKIIGEPFIQAKLLEVVVSKSDFSVADAIIEQRANELENLYRLRNNRNDSNQAR